MNTKQKLSMYAAIGFLAIAAFCAVEAKTGGGSGYAMAAIFTFAMGVISLGGIWSMGLGRRGQADRI